MAKCIRQNVKTVKGREPRTGEVRRVSNEEAAKLVATGEWHYVPKSTYQQYVNEENKPVRAGRRG